MVRKAKKIKKRTPSGRSVMRRGRRKPSPAKCAGCGARLHGMPSLRPTALKKLPKSKRRPNRPYGGNLCSRCMRELFKGKIK
jgi:large subunit ribosomal protein L34e